MLVKVKILRLRGARRSDREIGSDAGVDGQLTLYQSGGQCELKLFADDGSRQEPIIPILFDARLVTMHGDKMLFHGLERVGSTGDAQYLQEWSVMVLPVRAVGV
jgi:hypothetical protein